MLNYTLEMKVSRFPVQNVIQELTRFVVVECNGKIEIPHIDTGFFNAYLIFKIEIEDRYKEDFEYAYNQLYDYFYGTDYASKYKQCNFHYFVWFNRKKRVLNHWKIQLRKLEAISKVKCFDFGLFAIIVCNVYRIDKINYKLLNLARARYETGFELWS
jgi:hypothetical protein